jgi:hypothetical protein
MTLLLTPDGVNNLLELLEDNMPLRPEMHSLYQYMSAQSALALHQEDQQALGNDGAYILATVTST